MSKSQGNISALVRQMQYAQKHSSYYKKQFDGQEISVENALAVYDALPSLTKSDLSGKEAAFLAVPKEDIAEIVTTSGTTGDPLTVYLTKNDIDRLADNEKFSFGIIGIGEEDVIQITTTHDKLFMAGIAYYKGAIAAGATVLRVGPGNPQYQWDNIMRHGVTTLVAVPSFIIHMLKYAEANGIDYKNSKIKKILCIGEPIKEEVLKPNTLAEQIIAKWDVKLYSTYASTEMATAFTECTAENGVHHNPDLIFAQVIDDKGHLAEDGAIGELVVTPLQTEAMPFVKYKTGDICRVFYEQCDCGLTTMRLGPIIGRKNHLLKVKGTSVFPSSVTNVLDSIQGLGLYYVAARKDEFGNDTLTVVLEKQWQEKNEDLKKIKDKLKARIRVIPNFEFRTIKHLKEKIDQTNIRKKVKFIDLRN